MAASRGLGAAVASSLAEEGATVLGTSRQPGQRLILDTGDASSRQRCLEALREHRLDGIFVNTGGPKSGDVLDLSDQDWSEAFETLLIGPLHLVRSLIPQLNPGASILFNTSSSIREPIAHLALSNVIRAGIYSLAKTLADELGPQQIRVNAIVPGRIDTDRVRELDAAVAHRSGTDPAAVRQRLEAAIPLRRYGATAEFGRLAAFLLSPAATYLTGHAYWVDGGHSRSL
jgi:3-oxoacyl-[acyl-carrier protein] reductase